jgi:hypothetical protein
MKRSFTAAAALFVLATAAQAEWLVNNSIVTNLTGSAQSYQFYAEEAFTLNTTESLVQGSVTVTLLDRGEPANGASFGSNLTPVYKAFIDGNEVETLLDAPYTLSTAPPNRVASVNQFFGTSVSSGGTMWDVYGAGVVSNIAIQIEFTLSPGDSATVLSRFEVIPEPASLLLIGLTTSAALFIRRWFVF